MAPLIVQHVWPRLLTCQVSYSHVDSAMSSNVDASQLVSVGGGSSADMFATNISDSSLQSPHPSRLSQLSSNFTSGSTHLPDHHLGLNSYQRLLNDLTPRCRQGPLRRSLVYSDSLFYAMLDLQRLSYGVYNRRHCFSGKT